MGKTWVSSPRPRLYLGSSCGALPWGKCLVSSSVTLIEGCRTGSSSPVRGAAGSPDAGAEKTGCGLVDRVGGLGLISYGACGVGAGDTGAFAAFGGREAIILEIPTPRRMNPI